MPILNTASIWRRLSRPGSPTVWAALGGMGILFAGCGGETFDRAPVSGRVTLDGTPVAGALVNFQPIQRRGQRRAGPGSNGRTDDQGRFSLKIVDGRDGAILGDHDVTVSTGQVDEDAQGAAVVVRPEIIPEKYQQAGELKFTVSEDGSDQANFDLTSD